MATGIMIMLVNIDMTIVNLALADIAKFFNANLNQMQWVIGGYLLATALSFIIFGRMADHWGRKKIFLLGVSLFTFASLLAGVTDNLGILIVARFIQGLGFAATLGLSIILIVSAFPEQQKGFATGMAVTISGLSQAIGPTLGGVILQYSSWHWIFLINVPLGVLSFILTAALVSKDLQNTKTLPFNFFEIFLFIGGLGLILCSINQASTISWKLILISLIVGALLLIVLTKNAQRKNNALIDVSIFSNRAYFLIITLRLMFMIMMSSLLFILPLYLQNMLNFSPLHTGLLLLIMTGLVAIMSPITGKFLDKIGFFPFLRASFVLALVATLVMFNYQATVSFFTLTISFVAFGMAIGIHTTSSINGAMTQIDKAKSGQAMGGFFTAAMIGATTGVAISGLFINLISKRVLSAEISGLNGISSNDLAELIRAANGTANIHQIGINHFEISTYQEFIHHAFIYAFRVELLFLSLLMVAAIVLSLRLKRILVNNTIEKCTNGKSALADV